MVSFTADSTIPFMSSSVAMWTGIFSINSHVETVGRQRHPAGQPCTNLTVNFFGNPSGGMTLDPVSHLYQSPVPIPGIAVHKCKKNYLLVTGALK